MVRIFSQNVRGMSDYNKRCKIYNFFKLRKCYILCLQETHSEIKNEKFWKSEWGGEMLFSHGTNNSKGVAICFAKNFECEVIDVYNDLNGRSI